ncbi:MAG: molybdate ABC transporter substrate-binding protein [Candidatus Dormibacteraeota bacterium]|nr:molybdate ABC transporter substrate-binding protein [Candidatus Dormibacteraeota bacterium]
MPIILLLFAWVLAGCGGPAGAGTASPAPTPLSGSISVFAAASLTESFKALATAFQKAHTGVTIQYNFAGTPTLVTQIEQGAQADVFASADTANMEKLKADGYTSGDATVFAHNQLEIVVAPGNPKGISTLADLAKSGVIYLSEAPTVPAGKYSLQALAKAGVSVTPRSLETDVKSVVSKVELGEADAGIVYTTDVKAAGSKVAGVLIPASYNVVAAYPIVTVKGSKHSDTDNAFIAFVLSAAGQSTLASFGFQHS